MILVTIVAATLGAFVLAPAAYADPTPEEIEAQIDDAWRELEPIIEEHNATRIELEERREEAERLSEEIEPLRLKVDMAMDEVSDIAVQAFMGGHVSAFNALLRSGSPYTFAEQLSALDQIANVQQQQISEVAEVKEELEAEKAELDALVEQLEIEEADLAERAEEIDTEIERLQEMRIEAYGESGGLGDLRPVPCPTTYPGGDAGEVISFACAQIGKPYVWGAGGPDSYDCSGLTAAAWAQVGVNLPHNAAQQRDAVRYIDRSELRPGDLVFYYSGLSHVGLYAGDGWIVHASQAGVPVRMSPIDQSPIHSYGRPG